MDLTASLLPELENEIAGTRKVLERIPADKFDYKPHEKSGSMIWLANHIATICDWGHTTLTTPELTLDDWKEPALPTTSEELLAVFEKSAAQYTSALKQATTADLMHVWTMTFKGTQMMSMPRVAVLRGMVMNHLVHHRGQLTVYLRLNGIPVPGLYGPSADEPPMTASA